jgi:hypothetical protein
MRRLLTLTLVLLIFALGGVRASQAQALQRPGAPAAMQSQAPAAAPTVVHTHPGYYVSNAPEGPRLEHPLTERHPWETLAGAVVLIVVMIGIVMVGIRRGVATGELTPT